MTNLLRPVEPPFPGEIWRALAHYPRVEGTLLSVFRTFANSERFLQRGVPYLLDRGSPLELRTRETVILRITARNQCAYEWGVHAALFRAAAGFSDAEIAATWAGADDDPVWTPDEQVLLKAVDEFCANGVLHPDTRVRFQSRWSVAQQLEILALCGAYHTVSFVANLAQLEPEAFALRPPMSDRDVR